MPAAAAASAASIWEGDTLNRKSDAEFLLRFLIGRLAERKSQGRTPSYVLNLDAPWGEGKTFFLDRFANYLETQGHLVAAVNAWQDDHADDPLLAVMAAIEKVVSQNAVLKKTTKTSLKKLASVGGQLIAAGAKGALQQAAVRYIGRDVTEHIKETLGSDAAEIAAKAGQDVEKSLDKIFDAEGKALIEKFSRAQRSINEFKVQLHAFVNSLSGDRKPPLFILVDELDRCRPSYAINLLERIKHLFDIENVVFILATDTKQLSHAVSAVYGAQFDGARYLTRFFDRTYSFEAISRHGFISYVSAHAPLDETKISLPPNIDISSFITGAVDYFNLSLRDIEKSYDILRTVISSWDLKIKIEIAALLPLVIGCQQKIDPALSSGFHAKMLELVSKNGPPRNLWRVHLISNRGFRQEQSEIVEGMDLFEDFIKYCGKPLPDISHVEHKTLRLRWVVQRFSDEFAILYGNSHFPGDPPFSAISRYPELVRSAGRLIPTIHVPKR